MKDPGCQFTTWQAQLKPQIYFLLPGQRISTYINTMSILLYSQATLTNLNPIFYLCLIFLYPHHALSPPLVFRGPPALPLPSPDDQSLTSILETPQQRPDFTLLIASATASMCNPSCSLHPRPRRRQRAPPSRRRRPSRAPKPQRYRHPRR